ncbi:efflux RND transporter periplasmic adaptor subunit [Sporomusa malonica]|uniref:RND family efflux transporter, MFP subunit n=1 Tax=Sporomusa malonica TaxID=112901 RepID=A0A1W2EYB7_9FIRM|nr:efflux RND transporter periplasmic adaptor subunit [Sporomusa malonica]SMD14707.1 RND family efflux transporter, MFP subunit [Sporomusa malonica]
MKKIRHKYRMFTVLSALLFTLALLLATGHNLLPVSLWNQHISPRTPISITAVPVGAINKPIQLVRTGSVESSTVVPINAEFSGQLSELYVTAGQAVKAGQPLLKLQVTSEPTVNQTSQQAQANYDNALKEFNRYQKLFEIGGISKRQLDSATTQLQAAKDSLSNTQQTISAANATINGTATITAPINGIVTGLSVAPGKTVQAGQQLLSLGSGQEVEVVVRLDQNDLYLVHLGTPAALEAAQQTIVGQVSSIYPQIDASQSPSFLAHIKLITNPAGLLKSGMSINVHIDTGTSAMVPAVPSASISQDNQGRAFIYLATNGKAMLHQITTGEAIGDLTEITSNLPQQSMVITNNTKDLRNGDAITVVQ